MKAIFNKHTELTLLLMVGCLLFLTNLSYLYVDIMEARNFVSAREMVDDGNWIFTTLNGEARYQKPPLPTWLSAMMGSIFGTDNVGALRFPAGLSCLLLAVYLYKLLHKISSNKVLSFYAVLIFMTSFLVIFVGKRATWDIFSYSFALMGTYHFYKTLISSSPKFIDYILAGFFFGCSIMSKGPTGFYVILAPFLFGYLVAYGLPNFKQWKGWLITGVTTLIIGCSWYVYIYLNDQETFVNIMEVESMSRTNREVKSFTRYLSFPIQMGIWAILSVISLIYPWIKPSKDNQKIYRMLFFWTISCFVLLCLVPSKKERYLFPLMIPLAATTGFYFYEFIRNTDAKIWEKWVYKFTFSLLGLICIAFPFLMFWVLKVEFNFWNLIFSLVLVLVSIYLLNQTLRVNNQLKAFLATVSLMIIFTLFGTPIIDQIFHSNQNYHSITSSQKSIQNSKLKLYSYKTYSPEIWFKMQSIMPNIGFELSETLPIENEFLMVSESQNNLSEFEKSGYKIKKMGEFDDNEENQNSKNYVTRKKLNLYQLSKQTLN